ncbi:MAG: 1-acyl-sn-glycerol-3-phosphate acyltransferase [Flavobacteriia bacterium]|nr:1-acyl-sn-glycerol-3-phosphate acyltransferase [Flavobacteriia bacterium]
MKIWKFIGGNTWKLYVGIVFFLTGILLYPIFLIFLYSEKGKKFCFKLSVCWSWLIRIFCCYHVHKVKKSELPNGPYIIISNHASYLDIFLMCTILPEHPFIFLGKSELLKYPILATYFKKLHIPVFRHDKRKAAQSFIQAKKAVKNGWSLMIFPEGGIADEHLPKMMPFKDGAFKLAKSLHVSIVPLTFTNNHLLFSDPSMWFGGAYPGISKVHIHHYISAEEIQNMDEKVLLKKCFDIINQPLLEKYPDMESWTLK